MALGSPDPGLASTIKPLAERYVAVTVQVESFTARGLYWCATFVALILLVWVGLIANQTVREGSWSDGLLYGAILLAIAGGIYFLGWGWRWLWTGRTNNLFGRKKYTPPGPLEAARRRVTTVLSFWTW